jgi:hypothetical protein
VILNPVVLDPIFPCAGDDAAPAPTVIVYDPGDVEIGTEGLYAIPPAPPPPPTYLPPPPPPAITNVSTEVNDGLVTVKVPDDKKV